MRVPIRIDLPEDFLSEEERCGYTVTHEMKCIWAVLLDLLSEFQRVCRKHGLRYFASGGTMLGAVRHGGFIPWDDDLDVMMFRGDFDRLCEVASAEFKHPYFFQTNATDPGSLYGPAKLRNSLTTGILNSELSGKFSFNQGLFMDIFPLDTVIDNPRLLRSQFRRLRCLRFLYQNISRYSDRWLPFPRSARLHHLRNWMRPIMNPLCRHIDYNRFYAEFVSECSRWSHVSTSRYVSTLTFRFYQRTHFKFRRDYEEAVIMPFEFLSVPVGACYEHALSVRYGDWQTFVHDGSCHGGMHASPFIPYDEYIRRL